MSLHPSRPGRFPRGLAAGIALWVLTLGAATGLSAQANPKTPPPTPTARVVKGPETGQRAPDFTLPWANREVIGPEDQSFRLTDNLGKVVVLAFYARDFTPGSIAQLQGLAAVADSSGPEVVVVAISSDSLETHRRFANSIGIKYLLLSDPDQRVTRRYGSDGSDGVDRPTVYVIKPDGKVSYRDLGLEPQDRREFESLRKAIVKAGQP